MDSDQAVKSDAGETTATFYRRFCLDANEIAKSTGKMCLVITSNNLFTERTQIVKAKNAENCCP